MLGGCALRSGTGAILGVIVAARRPALLTERQEMIRQILVVALWHMYVCIFAIEDSMPTSQPTAVTLPIPIAYFTPNETVHVLSVTVRIHAPAGYTIIFTTDGTLPQLSSENTIATASNTPIILDAIGTTTICAKVCLPASTMCGQSALRSYKVIGRCQPPIIFPLSGTFPGFVNVSLHSETLDSKISYTTNGAYPNSNDAAVHTIYNGQHMIIDDIGFTELKAVTSKQDMADSAVATAFYQVRAQVATPVILPATNVFTISATLTVTCAGGGVTLWYTLDGADPDDNSLTLISGASLTVETAGRHELRVLGTGSDRLASSVTRKVFTIMERVPAPVVSPPSGSYSGDLRVYVRCAQLLSETDTETDSADVPSNTTVFYTTVAHSTPSLLSPSLGCLPLDHLLLLLKAPGKYSLRLFAASAARSASAIVQQDYVLSRAPYDTHPLHLPGYSVRPNVTIDILEKDLDATYAYYCDKRRVRGRLVTLANPLGHFDIVEPTGGCGGGPLQLPSESGRAPALALNSWDLRTSPSSSVSDNSSRWTTSTLMRRWTAHHLFSALNLSQTQLTVAAAQWRQEFAAVQQLGCEVVTNGGFFNVSSHACFGDLVTSRNVRQVSDKHNVNFGIRNGSFVVGYVSSAEVLDQQLPFDTLISGLLWLVRDGASYVSESLREEDMGAQSTGSMFASVLSARTCLGHDRQGRLLLLQVEGETWVRGMTLYEFAALAVELGFLSAVNLDGGGSATMTQNHSLVSEPSWRCVRKDGDVSANFRCEKEVSSITCVHAMAPPLLDSPSDDTVTVIESSSPSLSPSPAPSALTTTAPVSVPATATSAPSWSWPEPGRDDDWHRRQRPTASPSDFATSFNTSLAVLSAQREVLSLQQSVGMYRLVSLSLAGLLSVSLLLHVWSCLCLRCARRRSAAAAAAAAAGTTVTCTLPEDNCAVQLTQTHTQLTSTRDRDRDRAASKSAAHANVSWQQQLAHVDLSMDSGDEVEAPLPTRHCHSNSNSHSRGHFNSSASITSTVRDTLSRQFVGPTASRSGGAGAGYAQVQTDDQDDYECGNRGLRLNPFNKS